MTISSSPIPDIISILPAAGIGSRMQTDLPKQYLTIGNKTIIEHAIDALLRQSCIRQAIVAISPVDCWYHQLPVATNPRVCVVTGGMTRIDSVIAALHCINTVSWVLIHDAVRPCLYQDDLHRLLAIATQTDIGGLLASPVRDTMKRTYAGTNNIAGTIKRDNLWHALTPQIFTYDLLKYCLERAIAEGIILTDESSALEYYGYKPIIVPGRADNIKVTYPEDLSLARFFFSQLVNMENT